MERFVLLLLFPLLHIPNPLHQNNDSVTKLFAAAEETTDQYRKVFTYHASVSSLLFGDFEGTFVTSATSQHEIAEELAAWCRRSRTRRGYLVQCDTSLVSEIINDESLISWVVERAAPTFSGNFETDQFDIFNEHHQNQNQNARNIAINSALKHEPFCVIVENQGSSVCFFYDDILAQESMVTPAAKVTEFCREKLDKVADNLVDCVDTILPLLQNRISGGDYIFDIDADMERKRNMDFGELYERFYRLGYENTNDKNDDNKWGGAGTGAVINATTSTPTGHSAGDVTFVQIGAHVGRTIIDPIFSFAFKYNWSGVLCEPIPSLFNELVENYKTNEEGGWNVAFEMSAVCEYDGVGEFELVEPSSKKDIFDDESGNDEYKYKGGGVSARGRLTQYIPEEKADDTVEFGEHADIVTKRSVNCIQFESLMKKHNVKNFKVLQLDAEGADLSILKSVDFQVRNTQCSCTQENATQ